MNHEQQETEARAAVAELHHFFESIPIADEDHANADRAAEQPDWQLHLASRTGLDTAEDSMSEVAAKIAELVAA